MKTQRIPSRMTAMISALGLLALLGACASKGIAPVAELTTARASIAQAESAGALEAAPVELLAARDKLGKAEASAREERFDEARRLAQRAEADAELAERKARAVKARAAAAELARSNDLLRKEIERKSVR
ncbi:MAG: DUF4398 domain-containing protein [Burkholderiaceae bacterium]|nr:DUF4398 domain-containing protein [Burkholderiaceae bacterium]